METAALSQEVLFRDDRRHEAVHLLRDDDGRPLALIEAEAHFTGDVFDDPDARDDGWFTFSVRWSRSGTIYPGALRSNDLDASCAAVAAWETSSDPDREALVEDHSRAWERAQLAAAELRRGRDTPAWSGLQERAHVAFADLAALEHELRRDLERFGVTRGLDARQPLDPEREFSAVAEAESVICRESVLQAATEELTRRGVAVGLPAGLLAGVAARLGAPADRVRALWPSEEALEAEVLLTLAKQGVAGRGDDKSLIETWNHLAQNAHRLVDPVERREVLDRVIARVAVVGVGATTESTAWRNYVACTTAASRSESLAASLRDAMSAAEEAFATRMGEFYENVLPLLGHRLRPQLRGDHRAFGVILVAAVEGLGIVRPTLTTVLSARYGTRADPVDVSALAVSALVESLLEPEPDYDPAAARLRLTEGLTVT